MIKIGTRASQLALGQARFTQTELRRFGVESELVIFKTFESAPHFKSVSQMQRRDSKEIENALLRGEIDVAVYSMKELPTSQAEGLVITAVSQRDDPAELLLMRPEAVEPAKIFKIKSGAAVGVSTALRKAQLRDFRPDLELLDLDGDAPARLQQIREGRFNAVMISAAAANCLGLDLNGLEVLELNPREFIPAPAQGVLAWQTHRDDLPTRRILKQIHQPEISARTNVERKVLQLLGGESQLPLGVFVERDAAGNFHAFAAYELEGRLRRARLSQNTSFGLAEKLVEQLLG